MIPPSVLIVGSPPAAERLRAELERNQFQVEQATATALPNHVHAFTAVVVHREDGLPCCQRLSVRPIDDRPLVLYLAPDDAAASRLTGYERGADCVAAASATAGELAAQVRVFARWQAARLRWRDRTAAAESASQQLQIAYKQIELDLSMARRLQASFLPSTLPAVGAARFGVSYRPCGQVGGDFYDVVRLDERHVGFYIADAMGHGVPASLLTVFLKKAVHAKEVTANSYRLVPPNEVLARLNRDLIAQNLPDLPFITMIYALLDCQSGRLQFARAAHPHPIHLPQAGTPGLWQTPGTLLGAFEAEYPLFERQLRPGDRLLLHTDGFSDSAHDPQPVIAAAEPLRGEPLDNMVEKVAQSLLADEKQTDDFTLLAVEMAA